MPIRIYFRLLGAILAMAALTLAVAAFVVPTKLVAGLTALPVLLMLALALRGLGRG